MKDSLCNRQDADYGLSSKLRIQLKKSSLVIACGLLLIATSAMAAMQSVVVSQPGGAGKTLQMYVTATGQTITLQGTEKMNNAVIGDVDSNGVEDEIVYTDASTKALRYYKITGDGQWYSTNDHSIPNAPTGTVPLTVLRTGGTGTTSRIIYNYSGQTYKISNTGTLKGSIGQMDKAFALDIRALGYKGDLLWWKSGVGMRWREGMTGTDHKAPYTDWIPLGGGQIYPDQTTKVITFYASKDSVPKIYVCDKNFAFTRVDGTNWTWCTNNGSLLIGEADNSGPTGEVVFAKSATSPLQWYNAPASTSLWDANGLVTASSVIPGWTLKGIAKVDISSTQPPPPPPPPTTTPVAQISGIKSIADGTIIQLAEKPRTKLVREINSSGNVVVTGYYVEETDRSSGIRVVGTTAATEGQLVSVTGTLSTLNGERVIMASGEALNTQKSMVAPLVTSLQTIFGTVAMTGLLVQSTGTITARSTDSFILADSSSRTIKVYCADTVPALSGQFDVKGCVGAEKDASGAVVPVLRVEAASDITQNIPPPPITVTPKYSAWTRAALDRVLKTDATQTLQSITVKAAKNEHEPFQIVMRTSSTAVNSITLATSDLVSSTGQRISASNVSLFLERYINLPTMGVDHPDPLPPYAGAFNMATSQTQPIWVDIFVPKGVSAGDYNGTVTISDSTGAKTDVPYVLHVYNFTLPDDWKQATQFGARWDNIADKHGVARGSAAAIALDKKYYEFMLQHGFSIWKLPVDIMSSDADAYLKDPRMTGFEIPYTTDATRQRAIVDKIKSLGVFDKGYLYPWDEPDTQSEYNTIMQKSNWIHNIDPNTHVICVFTANPTWQSGTIIDALSGYCDIWCPKTSFFTSSIVQDLNTKRQAGDTIWSYYCLGVPREQWVQIYLDCAPVAYPLIFWQNYDAQVTGFLYWDEIYWEEVSDPWTSMQTAKSVNPQIYGEGSLLYPGNKVGVDGPVSSIRLELLRGGLEDYQYMWLLEQKIGRANVLPYIHKVTTGWTSWSRDSSLFSSAKDEIAKRLEN